VQLFTEHGREKDPVCGVVGRLQFDVLTFRLEHEYGATVAFDLLPYQYARWVEGAPDCEALRARRVPMAVLDRDDRVVALFRDEWELGRAERDNESWIFHETAPIVAAA
jgi:peptide chain release factor 3